MAKWGKRADRGGDPLADKSGPTIFEIIKKHNRDGLGAWSTFWLNEKDIPRVAREIYESIPLMRNSSEPMLQTDIPSALRRGGITIGKTKIKVKQ